MFLKRWLELEFRGEGINVAREGLGYMKIISMLVKNSQLGVG